LVVSLHKPNMKSKVDLLLGNVTSGELSKAELNGTQHLALPYGGVQKMTLDEGYIIVQSYSNYLVFVEHFEVTVTQTAIIDLRINSPGFFLFLMVSGSSIFEDHKRKRISETDGNSCALTYLNAGFYKRVFLPGTHRMLLLTYRDEFFLKRAEFVPEFTPLIRSFLMKEAFFSLPQCPISIGLFNAFKKLIPTEVQSGYLKFNAAVQNYGDECLDKYQKHLEDRHYDLSTVQRMKMLEISEYIKKSYVSNDTKNISFLANKFGLSVRSLERLVFKAFQLPLNKQVNEFRLSSSIVALMSSDRPIAEIARSVGFKDVNYFSRAFKRRFGVPPSEIRQ